MICSNEYIHTSKISPANLLYIKDARASEPSRYILRYILDLFLCPRLVNGVADSQQRGRVASSVAVLSAVAGLPRQVTQGIPGLLFRYEERISMKYQYALVHAEPVFDAHLPIIHIGYAILPGVL